MLRVALTGPESTGKTTLCRQLAEAYRTVCAFEFAQQHLEAKGSGYAYSLADLEEIARGQLAAEEDAARRAQRQNRPVIFCDTELLVIKIWAEHAFGTCPDWITDEIGRRSYDLILLTGIDVPWEPNPLREHPHLRQHFYELYRHELTNRLSSFAEVTGSPAERLAQACFLIDELLLGQGHRQALLANRS